MLTCRENDARGVRKAVRFSRQLPSARLAVGGHCGPARSGLSRVGPQIGTASSQARQEKNTSE